MWLGICTHDTFVLGLHYVFLRSVVLIYRSRQKTQLTKYNIHAFSFSQNSSYADQTIRDEWRGIVVGFLSQRGLS